MLNLRVSPLYFSVLATLAALPFEGLQVLGVPLVRTTGFVCFCIFLFTALVNHQRFYVFRKSHLNFTLFVVCLCLLSVILGGDVTDSGLAISIAVASNLIFFLIGSVVLNNENRLCIATYCLGYSLVLSVLLSIASDLSLVEIGGDLQNDLGLEKTRQAGFLRNANRFSYLALSVFWAVCLLDHLKVGRWFHKRVLFIAASVCIVMSMSRAGLVSLFIGYIYILLFSTERKFIGYFVFVPATILLISDFSSTASEVYVRSISMLENRLDFDTTMSSGSMDSRFAKYESTFSVIADNPIFGASLGSLVNSRGVGGYEYHDPHNTILFLVQYFGIFGWSIIGLGLIGWIRIVGSPSKSISWRILIHFWLMSLLFFNMFHTTITWKGTVVSFLIIFVGSMIHEKMSESSKAKYS